MFPTDNAADSDQIDPQAKFDSVDLDSRIADASPVSDNPNEVTDVALDKINSPEIASPEDFKSPDHYAGMRREAEMLKQMQPAIEQGATADTFDEWDKGNQIGHYSPDSYIRGYVDTYHSYYDGNEVIALDPKADGTYDVINGRHRICVAREVGLKTVPAKILGT